MIPMFRVLMADAAKDAVAEVLQSGYIGQGPVVDEFEREFAQAVKSSIVPLTTNSCTSALDLALHLCGVGHGDAVVTTPQTCTATNGVIVNRGAAPVWADVDPITGLIDPQSVGKLVEAHRITAIMAVDWAGRSCDYTALKKFGLPVIQDAAHVGPSALWQEHGDYVAWSFQAIKFLTTGDGGALLVPPGEYQRAKLLRWYGLDRESGQSFRCAQDIKEVGYKYHMNDIAAAIGLANLEPARIALRTQRSRAARYCREFRGLDRVVVPDFDQRCSYWLFTILVENRDDFTEFMRERGIETSQVHARNDKHTAFRLVAPQSAGELPGLETFDGFQVSIPVGWWLSSDEEALIVGAVKEWSNRNV